jgi:hypothetical protein
MSLDSLASFGNEIELEISVSPLALTLVIFMMHPVFDHR